MVSSSELIEVIEKSIKSYGFKNIVIDPVMVSTSGFNLIKDNALSALEKLFPLASLITPNINEAEIISNTKIKSKSDIENAAKIIFKKFKTPVLVKGGHSLCDANDFLYSKNGGKWFFGKRIKTENTHGTGCTLSSAIASNLSKDIPLEKSIKVDTIIHKIYFHFFKYYTYLWGNTYELHYYRYCRWFRFWKIHLHQPFKATVR